ncbi:MAG: c-type cytochrome [Chitinophagales bacterium]|tara:strand:+ start:18341 stop:19744 length:1404 start_codon:yes stop_codon:yes gene_type:complete
MTFSRLNAPKHSVRSIFHVLLLFILSTFTLTIYAQDAVNQAQWDNGKSLFKSQCQSCHLPDKKMTGPALQYVRQRWIDNADYKDKTGEEWLYEWIRNNSSVLATGHTYANALYNEYDKSVMSLFPQLSDEEIDDILYYADNFDKGSSPAAMTAAGGGETVVQSSFPMETFLWILVGSLGFIALILWRVFSMLNRLSLEKAGVEIPQTVPIWKNKKLITLVNIIVVVFAGYYTVSSAIGLGRQQTYAPEQPIKYSHELHAGKYQIDCQYCHSGASQSKHSNIPSVNVCMNCHKNIQEGPQHGREEIAKIYSAIAYNPNKGTYFADDAPLDDVKAALVDYLKQDYEEDVNQDALEAATEAAFAMYDKPVEWVRIHNLPDHVYFNHAQHVNAGNVECQTCHGNIQEMEVVAQHAPLSMGWCINCHRETEVDMGNNYYQVYEQYHEDLKSGAMDKVTVEDVGGTECQKCHY